MTATESRYFAIVPAAGQSRRMGEPKLLLPWRHHTVIDHVLQTWMCGQISDTVVVTRADDTALHQACKRWPVHLIRVAETPSDMKESVQIGLRFLASHRHPSATDACFIAPADLPTLSVRVIDDMIASHQHQSDTKIVVPMFGERIGHPALFPWSLTSEIFDLDEDAGINRIVDRSSKREVSFPAEDMIRDIDTPEAYQDALRRDQNGNG